MRKRYLGQTLIEEGLLTSEQLTEALEDSRKKNVRLGEYLVKQGLVLEEDLVEAMAVQFKAERYNSEKYPLDTSLGKEIPRKIVDHYHAVPIMKRGTLLLVAMLDPSNMDVFDGIEMLTGMEIEPLICTKDELNHLSKTIYGNHSDLHGALEGMGGDELETEAASGDGNVEINSLQNMAEEVPVIRLVNSILSKAIKDKVSDIHINPGKKTVRVRFRIDGKMHDGPGIPKAMFLPIVSRIKIISNLDIAVSRVPQDGRFTVRIEQGEVNIRVSTLPSIHGENVVMRLLDTSGGILSLEDLGFLPEEKAHIEKMIRQPYGMILATGPTGSGKSTTLYSMLQQLNDGSVNIITLEDPVEYQMDKVCQVQLNRKVGLDFATGLRSILRQDPDVVLVGEIRDVETAKIGVQAALTGHRVLSTVHTNDAAGAVTRFIDMGVEPFLVSSVMLVSVAQRLLRRICPNCKESYTPEKETLKFWGLENVKDANFSRGKGCMQCMNTGYKGRTGIYEVLLINDRIREMIIQDKSALEITEVAKKENGMRSLKDAAIHKLIKGETTFEEAIGVVMT